MIYLKSDLKSWSPFHRSSDDQRADQMVKINLHSQKNTKQTANTIGFHPKSALNQSLTTLFSLFFFFFLLIHALGLRMKYINKNRTINVKAYVFIAFYHIWIYETIDQFQASNTSNVHKIITLSCM